MASAASTTPFGNASSYDGFPDRPLARQIVHDPPLRPKLKRRSPLSNVSTFNGIAARAIETELGDSSEDEGSAPLLSAAAEELLGLKTEERPGAGSRVASGGLKNWSDYAAGSPVQRDNVRHAISGLAMAVSSSTLPYESPRVVRLSRHSPGGSGSLRRAASTSSVHDGSPMPVRSHADLKTPAPRPKSAIGGSALSSNEGASSGRYTSGASVGRSASGTSGSQPSSISKQGDNDAQNHQSIGNGTTTRNKVEDLGTHNSLRIKRFGKMSGTILGAKPARRGIIRRTSEEEQSPLQGAGSNLEQPLASEPQPSQSPYEERSSPRQSPRSGSQHVRFATSAEVANILPETSQTDRQKEVHASSRPAVDSEKAQVDSVHQLTSPPKNNARSSTAASKAMLPPSFKVPPLLPSLHDQENEPPPTFKKNRPGSDLLGSQQMQAKFEPTPGTGSPVRKVLGPRSQNTPLRPAPPPPKMSVLETATATAGAASASQNKKRRNYITVNGKLFTRMECIGRGGSGRVYRVMAENFKLFALKRVSLEDVDELAIRGFKGEIDLLRKLENVDRVVRLYDYEINDEKKTLSVLMDIGEMDLKKILDPRLDEDTGKFDITFTRYIWKEMLECVQAIHKHDVVHSDLKPANFVLMQGRLKLIDFGIANAIQDDTVNVHREQQIGTPNYMAPEALLDTNAHALGGGSGRPAHVGKLMKLGKPSDMWSLGCILYQIVYGKPPFGHIPNQMNKVIAITDRSHSITYPEFGVGKMPVPTGLIRTLKKCLNRDPSMRPTCDSLLSERDVFLHPDATGTVPVSQELLKRLQLNILKIIEKDGMPQEAAAPALASGIGAGAGAAVGGARPKDEAVGLWLDKWGPQLFASMKAAVEKGTA